MVIDATEGQRELCAKAGAEPNPPDPESVMGVGPMDGFPTNGLRHPAEGNTSGWYVWTGGEIDREDPLFFRPVHVSHMDRLYPDIVPYLALPPGWRFQVAPDHEDVWFDPTLLISD
jgi:hypothetical protein